MQHFNVATYDQVLWYNGKQLLSAQNNCTLGELEIEPFITLLLKVKEKNRPNNYPQIKKTLHFFYFVKDI